MRDWLRACPMMLLLLPLIVLILLSRFEHKPIDLLQDTEFELLDSLTTYCAVVKDYPSPRRRSVRVKVQLLTDVRPQVYLYLSLSPKHDPNELSLGDTILVRTCVTRPEAVHGFNYADYLRLNGITGTAYASTKNWRLLSHGSVLFHPLALRHRLSLRLKELGFSKSERGTLSAMLLGLKEDLDPAVQRSFRASGAAHVLAVSGLHTAILYSVFWFCLTGFGAFRPFYTNTKHRVLLSVLLIMLIWAYALLTGFSPSVVRAALMLSIVQLGYAFRRRSVSINTLLASAFVILIFDPKALFSVSFQLSFMAVASILILMPVFRTYFPGRLKINNYLNSAYRYIRDLLLVSVAAWLGTMPLTLYYFGEISNYFMLTNLLVLPLTGIVITMGLLSLILGSIPIVGVVFVFLTKVLVSLMHHAVCFVESLPGAVSQIRISPLMLLLLYAALLLGSLTLSRSPWYVIPTAVVLAVFGYLYIIV